jgi:hypothetical protein
MKLLQNVLRLVLKLFLKYNDYKDFLLCLPPLLVLVGASFTESAKWFNWAFKLSFSFHGSAHISAFNHTEKWQNFN